MNKTEKLTHFATFGSEQLVGFDINPTTVGVYLDYATENELRARLNQEPFNNKYCTIYPISRFGEMSSKYGVCMYELEELLKLFK